MKRELLKEKAQVMSEIILATVKIYNSGNLSESQKGLMETLLGAGIWYLPNSKNLYSGKISKKAYESLIKDPINTKLVEEHAYPRKIAGQKLYTEFISQVTSDGEGLIKLYSEKFGRYNLVLKDENNSLKKFQKKGVFLDEETAYSQAGIELIPFPMEELMKYKNRSNKSRKNNL